MSLCSKTEARSSGSGFPPSSTPIKARVWASCAPSPSLLRWSHLATFVVLRQALCFWSPLLSCCFCLRCLSKGCWTSYKHLPLPRLMEPSKCSRAVVGDRLWSLPHFSLALTFYDMTEISEEFGAGGVTLLAPRSFYTSGSSAFEIFTEDIFGSHI